MCAYSQRTMYLEVTNCALQMVKFLMCILPQQICKMFLCTCAIPHKMIPRAREMVKQVKMLAAKPKVLAVSYPGFTW